MINEFRSFRKGALVSQPLDGVTVVEVSSLVAGPAMGSLLFDLGAEVIKIEQPVTGDPSRTVSPWGFLNYNLGKKSLSLNLKTKPGQEILHRLIERKKVDVFIENLGPDVPDRLGFSFNILRKFNPSLIYCSIKGFSPKSRYFNRPAFDAVAQALSGMMALTGDQDGEPVRVGNPSIDLGAAAYGTIQVLSGLLERSRSANRKGKFIEISLLDMSVYWNGYWLTYYGMTGRIPKRLGSGHAGYSPHRVFKTKDGKDIFIATLGDQQWRSLSALLKLDLDSSYDKMDYRISHRAETEKKIQDVVSKINSIDLIEILSSSVPCAEVRSVDEVYNEEELLNFGVLQGTINIFDQKVNHVRISRSPVAKSSKAKLPAPELGQHDNAILRSIGYSNKEIRLFKKLGYL
jgi:crotonobetainyl-CoA:carnitine CoA-transferase CaiB-like acyl-CoA transferase